MPFNFQFPVKLPRWTSEEFDQKRREHAARYGYTIHIPGFEDIFHWRRNPEPTEEELSYYRHGRVEPLGEHRFNEIKDLMTRKRERFLQMLASPTPRIAMNAASALTFLDDINDTLGTLGVVARTAAHLLPRTVAKFLTGPAGWLFLASDITNIAMELSRLPWKAKRLQHELHAGLGLNPMSKKARLRRLNKLKRLKLSKGEIIEGLQTTDNMFGIGISLGPIMGLIYDIPFGFYRAFQGRKVTVTGLPAPFYWADHVCSRFFRGCAQLFYGNPDFTDQELGQSMVAFNYATQWQKAYVGETSPLDYIDDPSDIELPIHRPLHPSTIHVIEDEVGTIDDYLGWPSTGTKWMSTNEMMDHHTEGLIDNIKDWEVRNRRDMESSVCAQNMIESGMNSIAILEGDDQVEWAYETLAQAYLSMFNNNYRLPLDATPEQLDCFTAQIQAYGRAGIQPSMQDMRRAATDACNFNLTTQVPARTSPTEEELAEQAEHAIDRLKTWYAEKGVAYSKNLCYRPERYTTEQILTMENELARILSWLNRYGWPEGEPETALSLITGAFRTCVAGKLNA